MESARRVGRRVDQSHGGSSAAYYRPMPIYMDVHEGLGDATPEDVAEAHRRDLEVQHKYGVRFLSYWFSDPEGKAFCLVEAPDVDTLVRCHKVAHGLTPHEVIEVETPTLAQFMGETVNDPTDRAQVEGKPDTALRTIMFTDIQGSTDVSTQLGDDVAVDLVRRHNDVVRDALDRFDGREVKHTGDGILASFVSVSKAVEASIAIQRTSSVMANEGPQLAVKIGLSAGEPVEDSNDLFGASVNLAARICAHAGGGQTLVSGTVKELALGKEFRFANQGAIGLKGFPDPVLIYEVDWQTGD